jgi:cytochrome c551/c552
MQLLLWSVLLVLALVWALYDEMIGLRPWRGYQNRFASSYTAFLAAELPKQAQAEEALRNSPEYQKMLAQLEAARAAAAPRKKAIAEEAAFVRARLDALGDFYQEKKALVTSLAYQWEISSSEGAKKSRLEDIEDAKKGPFRLRLPKADGSLEEVSWDYNALEAEFIRLKARQAQLGVEEAAADREAAELSKQLQAYFDDRFVGLTKSQIESLQAGVRRMPIAIRQIHVANSGLVDRCQSCHIAMDTSLVPPNLTLTKASLGVDASTDAPFTTHPNPELLKIHDPERFGCSPCHGGNGRATSSIRKGHGRHKYWLWPLYYRENMEAGCQQCHAADMVLEGASTINKGKELYRERGCVGCHRFEGFDNEGERLLSTRQQVRQLETEKKELELEIPRVIQRGDQAPDNAAAQQLYAQADSMRLRVSNIDARIEQLDRRAAGLMREEKKVGPSLKEVRQKLRPEWIPYWLGNTHTFRPSTKMPQFRLQPDEIEAIAAFIWQSGVPGPALQKQPPGNAQRGDQLFESRGCLACHSMGEGAQQYGGDFAANLSRLGEKANYDYIVRWVHNPRERTRPYCPYEKRDLGPEDYAKHGLPFVFDLDHSTCPNDGHQLQVQQQTVMPSLRITWEEARDIASYLVSRKRPDATYAPAPFLDDPNLKNKGRDLVRHYGCAGCHEIAGFEEEGRIGTELTTEGSKPIERLDFALLTHPAERGILPDGSPSPRGKWYDQKGFFESKLADPAVFDKGKLKENPRDRLRMPKPNLTPEGITALTTFLLGSVDPSFPASMKYQPTGQQKDIQEGWWIITKYNCVGCHQVRAGQKTALETLPQFSGANKEKLPPPLTSEGARVDPNWLAHFLENPAMSTTDTNRNGVRSYLDVRMPTFSFSQNEIRTLVRFFEAVSSQAQPYLPPKLDPLTEQERQVARALFTHPAAPCLKCHATGNPAHDRNATAPNFLLARERLRPAWTNRWIIDPAKIAPGTNMPSGLFRQEGDRWVFAGPMPPAARAYSKDHAELLVRYMFQLTPEEQRMLLSRLPAGAASGGND